MSSLLGSSVCLTFRPMRGVHCGMIAPTFTLRSSLLLMRRCISIKLLCKIFECTTRDINFAVVEYKFSEISSRWKSSFSF